MSNEQEVMEAREARKEFIVKFEVAFAHNFNNLIKAAIEKSPPSSYVEIEVHKSNLIDVKNILSKKGYNIECKHLVFSDFYYVTAYF